MAEAPQVISELVAKFEQNLTEYKHPKYNETHIRVEFVNPFFKALGWDVDNSAGYALAYRDVIHEDEVKVGSATKAPDYSFRIGGVRKFFLETKKPAVNLKDDPAPAFQLRRYAYSAKLPLSVLTDFEEFIVYDGHQKPALSDKPAVGRIKYYTFRDYVTHWDEIAAIFSKEALLKGSFDRFAAGTRGKQGTAEIDRDFLADLDRWRLSLARNLALRNADLSARALNHAVQLTIDRLIFLRMCEDRGIENYGQLLALVNGVNLYARLVQLYYRADERFNSGLFHFAEEKSAGSPPDTLTPTLKIDDKILKEIITRLYYPECPYEFSILPVEVLGNAYEQFLGKVIRLTAGHQAKIEEKPEVRKAGGVYYTPKYIVDYIVENTVGPLCANKTPAEVAGLRILDPACGSGSFLLGAYQYLLDWHLNFYRQVQETSGKIPTVPGGRKHKSDPPAIFSGRGGQWFLTTAEKKRILLNNIYGVDIDANAVEVTKLSLLLKVLENENQATLTQQLTLWRERALPDLGQNIKCGNSLIGSDFYAGQPLNLFDAEELHRINAFDWETEFPEVFANGGFDAVIGNPPYIQLSMADYFNDRINSFLSQKYSSSMGRLNTFGFFIERALSVLINNSGFLSFIIPNTVLTQEYYQSLRLKILDYRIDSIISYLYPVFSGAVVETITFVLQKNNKPQNKVNIIVFDNKRMSFTIRKIQQALYLNSYKNTFYINTNDDTIMLKQKIDSMCLCLKKHSYINQAIALKSDRSKSLFKEQSSPNYKKVIDGRNIQRYSLNWDGWYLSYDITRIHSCKRTDIFEAEDKLLFRRVGERLTATYDNTQLYALNTLVVITLIPGTDFSLKYILGLFNSKLLNFYYVAYLKSTKKIFSEIQARQVGQLPIRIIDFSIPTDKTRHDHLVQLVDQMLELHQKLAATEAHDRTLVQRQIAATDRQIDQLVYQLYDLTDAEIKIVEGA